MSARIQTRHFFLLSVILTAIAVWILVQFAQDPGLTTGQAQRSKGPAQGPAHLHGSKPQVDVEKESAIVTRELAPPPTFEVTVLCQHFDSGAPIPGIKVGLESLDDAIRPTYMDVSASNGMTVLSHVPSGRFQLAASDESGQLVAVKRQIGGLDVKGGSLEVQVPSSQITISFRDVYVAGAKLVGDGLIHAMLVTAIRSPLQPLASVRPSEEEVQAEGFDTGAYVPDTYETLFVMPVSKRFVMPANKGGPLENMTALLVAYHREYGEIRYHVPLVRKSEYGGPTECRLVSGSAATPCVEVEIKVVDAAGHKVDVGPLRLSQLGRRLILPCRANVKREVPSGGTFVVQCAGAVEWRGLAGLRLDCDEPGRRVEHFVQITEPVRSVRLVIDRDAACEIPDRLQNLFRLTVGTPPGSGSEGRSYLLVSARRPIEFAVPIGLRDFLVSTVSLKGHWEFTQRIDDGVGSQDLTLTVTQALMKEAR